MPVAAEMDVFQREVSGDQKLVTGGKAEYRAVVAYAGSDAPAGSRESPDPIDQRFLWPWQPFTIRRLIGYDGLDPLPASGWSVRAGKLPNLGNRSFVPGSVDRGNQVCYRLPVIHKYLWPIQVP